LRTPPSLSVSDIRLSIADRTRIVVGFSRTQEQHKQYIESKDWFESNSRTLTQVLDVYGESLTAESQSFEQFLHETVVEMQDNQSINPAHIAALLDIPKSFLAGNMLPSDRLQPTPQCGSAETHVKT
jgi:hypothetical protein